MEAIERAIAGTARRLRWMRGWQGLWKGAVAGAAVYLATLAAYKLLPLPAAVVPWAAILAILSVIAGFVVGYWRKTSRIEAARWLDEREQLQQRLATALEVSRDDARGRSAWGHLVVSDAAAIAGRIQPQTLLPLQLPRLARVLVAVMAVTVALGFLPEFRTRAHVQQQADAEVIREVGRQLDALTRKTLEQRPPAMEPVRRRLEEVQELGQRLSEAKLSRDEALKDLASTTDRLREQAADLARNPALKRMEKAARSPSGRSPSGQSSIQKQLDALQKQLGERPTTPEAADELQRGLDQLKEAAKGLADNASGNPEALQQQLAAMASDLARKAEALGLPLPSLDEAVAALQSSQIDQFLRDLKTAENDLEKLADLAQQIAQLQQQAQQMGRDLAEQLQNGQAEAAVESLRRLQALLQQPGLSEAQRRELQEEISRAVKPAGQYGEVGRHLERALQNARAGDGTQARESLAQAQRELEDLMKQMGDLEGMMASLANLQKAQACVGNCQGWGIKRGLGVGLGTGKGGKGVGTWSDSDAWSMPDQIDDLWDNSGINRPDQAGRGQTEREASVDGALAPTKVRGQMQPGGPMPNITLKGLSIRGESRVAYTEAVTSAQSEAQAALNQEQVPKAYRRSVRDYFDDLDP